MDGRQVAGLLRRWGQALVWRRLSGSGAMRNPPEMLGTLVLDGPGTAGDDRVGLRVVAPAGRLAVLAGRLVAGDQVFLAGGRYQVQAAAVAAGDRLAAVAIAPGLAADLADGTAAAVGFAADQVAWGAVIAGSQRPMAGNLIAAGDDQVLLAAVMPDGSGTLVGEPAVGDLLVCADGTRTVRTVQAIAPAGVRIAWVLAAVRCA